MSEHEKTRGAAERKPGTVNLEQGARRVVMNKFIQRRGVRGFNAQPMPASGPPPTPDPPAPKWPIGRVSDRRKAA